MIFDRGKPFFFAGGKLFQGLPCVVSFLSELTERVDRTISDRYARSTWNRHKYLKNMLMHFSLAIGAPLHVQTVILALEWIGSGTSRRTLLGYARTVRAMSRHFQNDAMDSYIGGLRAQAAKEPLHQAGEISKADVLRLLHAAPPELRWAIWLVWMTCSRWGDVQGLSRDRLLSSPASLIVDFQGVTKTSKTNPHRMDHLVAIPWTVPGAREFWTWAVTRSTLFPRTSTDVVTRLMRKVLGRSDVAAHSFKRSTLGIMLLAAHKGLIPMRLVAQMGKHLGLDPLLPDTTVGYIGNRVLLAETNHSALATPLLDPTHPFGASTTEVDHLKD